MSTPTEPEQQPTAEGPWAEVIKLIHDTMRPLIEWADEWLTAAAE